MAYPLVKDLYPYIPINFHPGAFGFKRDWNFHPGVDLYCKDKADVFAIFDSVVIRTGQFTGPEVGSPWWNTTYYAMLASPRYGVIFNYGEIEKPNLRIGETIYEGDLIGNVSQVLFDHKYRPDIPYHSCSMLHLEAYNFPYDGEPVEWLDKRPECLIDPTPFLLQNPYCISDWNNRGTTI